MEAEVASGPQYIFEDKRIFNMFEVADELLNKIDKLKRVIKKLKEENNLLKSIINHPKKKELLKEIEKISK